MPESKKLQEILEKLGFKSVDEINDKGEGSLYKAVLFNNKQATKILLEHGANPNFELGSSTLLSLAIEREKYNSIDLLLKYGAEITPKEGGECLMHIYKNSSKIYDFNIKSFKQGFVVGVSGYPELEAIKLLLEHNADTKSLEGEKRFMRYGSEYRWDVNDSDFLVFSRLFRVSTFLKTSPEAANVNLSSLYNLYDELYKNIFIKALSNQLVKGTSGVCVDNVIKAIEYIEPDVDFYEKIYKANNYNFLETLDFIKEFKEIINHFNEKAMANFIRDFQQYISLEGMPKGFKLLGNYIQNYDINKNSDAIKNSKLEEPITLHKDSADKLKSVLEEFFTPAPEKIHEEISLETTLIIPSETEARSLTGENFE
jgi:ankyrin repeat protein